MSLLMIFNGSLFFAMFLVCNILCSSDDLNVCCCCFTGFVTIRTIILVIEVNDVYLVVDVVAVV